MKWLPDSMADRLEEAGVSGNMHIYVAMRTGFRVISTALSISLGLSWRRGVSWPGRRQARKKKSNRAARQRLPIEKLCTRYRPKLPSRKLALLSPICEPMSMM